MKSKKTVWTIEMVLLLQEKYPTTLSQDLADQMNIKLSSVHNKAYVLKLKKDPIWFKSIMKEISQAKGPNSGQFKKGIIPFNKGKKMPDHVREKAKATMFKTGIVPHNTRQIGEFSDRPDKSGATYRYIKVAHADWRLYHRAIWEERHGKIPKGYRIHFKDGNTLNCSIENLECLTDQEAMDRNRITKYPLEIQEVIKLKNKLNKKIKDHGTK